MKPDKAQEARKADLRKAKQRTERQRITEIPAKVAQLTIDGQVITAQQAINARKSHQAWMAKQAKDKA